MFGKLKEKLKGWFKSSKEKIEADIVETGKEDKEEKSIEEKIEKVEKLIENAKNEPSVIVPSKIDDFRRMAPMLEEMADVVILCDHDYRYEIARIRGMLGEKYPRISPSYS